MTSVLRLNGIDHWVRDVTTDGSSEGIDYDVVVVHCRVAYLRFKRSVPVRVGIVPKCLWCYARQS